MRIRKCLTFILLFCLMFGYPSTKWIVAKNKIPFLSLVSITGNNKDPNSFRLNQNLISYFRQDYLINGKPEIPYYHQGLTTDNNGYIYFCDKGEGEIEVYDFLGNPTRSIGTVGTDSGEFQLLNDICIDESGTAYALDSFKNNIQVFDKTGEFIREFSLRATSDKRDPLPLMMTLSNDQNLFILDRNNGGKIFSKKGKLVGNFIYPLAENTENPFQYVTDICADELGNVYLLDNFPEDGSPFFWIFGPDGNIRNLDPIPLSFGDDERTRNFCPSFTYFEGTFYISLMTDIESQSENTTFRSTCLELTFEKKNGKDGGIFFAQAKPFLEDFLQLPISLLKTRNQLIGLDAIDNRLVYFDQKGKPVKEIKSTTSRQMLLEPQSVEADINETLYISEPKYQKIIALSPSKNEVSLFDTNTLPLSLYNYYEGQWSPSLVSIDHSGNTFIYDKQYSLIHVVDSNKKLIQHIPIFHKDVLAMDFNEEGNLVILASDGEYKGGTETSVEIYDTTRGPKDILQKSYFSLHDSYASDLSIATDDRLYIASKDKVLVYSITGEKLNEWEFKGFYLDRLFTALENNCYLLAGSTVIKVDSTGKILDKQDLAWFRPTDISGNTKGEIFITDDFHGLLLTWQDTTFQPKPIPTPLYVTYIPEKTFFSTIEIQGRTIPDSFVSIGSKPAGVGTNGTFSETVDLLIGLNNIQINAKSANGLETSKKFLVQRLENKTLTLKIGKMGAANVLAFIDKETKRTYVVFRYLLETMGGAVEWDSETQKISYHTGTVELETFIGSPKARVNGKVKVMDPDFPTKVFPKIINKTTYAPLRFLSENLGYLVLWDAKKNQVTLSFPDEKFIPQEKIDPPEDFDDIEWSKQYGISRGDYSGPIATKNGNLSMINNTRRTDADFWFLQVNPAGKPIKSLLYSIPHNQNDSVNFNVNDNQLFSAVVNQKEENIYVRDLSKIPILLNYCLVDTMGKMLESKTLSITSKQKMIAEFIGSYPLTKNRYMIDLSLDQEEEEKFILKGFLVIDSKGKLLNSFKRKINRDNNESMGIVLPCGNDSFIYMIHHTEHNTLKEMDIIGFRDNGDIMFHTSFSPKTSSYSYPEVVPCKKGFLLKLSNNEKSFHYFLRFSEKGTVLWQKEIQLNAENQETFYALKERPGEGFIFMHGITQTPGNIRDLQLVFLAKSGDYEKSYRLTSESYSYITKCDFADNNLFLVGGKPLRSFADTNIWISKMNPGSPLYRYFLEGTKITLNQSAPYHFSSDITKIIKETFPITLEAKDLKVTYREVPVDYQ